MTRKHFEALALTLKTNNASLDLCGDVARICEATNDKFNSKMFLEACGFNFKENEVIL